MIVSRLTQTRNGFRSGVLSIGVILCLIACTAILAAMANALLLARRSVRLQQPNVQVSRLAEAGLRLAAKRLRENPSYEGEVWTIPALPARRHNLTVTASATVCVSVADHEVTSTAVLSFVTDKSITATRTRIRKED